MPGRAVGSTRVAVTLAVATASFYQAGLKAETLADALAYAYVTNPQLNAERARQRVTDEAVPQALSGYRPHIIANASVAGNYTNTKDLTTTPPTTTTVTTYTKSAGVTATQNLFNGFQTANRTRQAEQLVSAGREALRLLEQQVLLDAATAYMSVLRDMAVLQLQNSNVQVLKAQLQLTRNRLAAGEVTETDVKQAESRFAGAQSAFFGAEANLAISRASYRRVIGKEPVGLAPALPVDRLSPATLAAAIERGVKENPLVTSAMYGIDVAALQVKINEGALYPVVAVQGNIEHTFESGSFNSSEASSTVVNGRLVSGSGGPIKFSTLSASAAAQLIVPLYQGGTEYSLIRQSKETVGQQRLSFELQRNQVRVNVVSAWALLGATKAQIQAAETQVTAAAAALNGVRNESAVGLRTTLDVLNAQMELVNARVALVTAQRDRLVMSYTLLNTTGRLSPQTLGLNVPVYDPQVHYHQVRDAWIGVRTPDGR